MADVLVKDDELRQIVEERLSEAGLIAPHAKMVADVLVHADLRGVRSHGVIRTEHYVTRLKGGTLSSNPTFTVNEVRSGAAVLIPDFSSVQAVSASKFLSINR